MTATVGPGGVLSSTDSHSPAMPWAAASATEPSCHTGRRSVHSRTVAAGTTNSEVASSAPMAVSDATTANATSTSSAASGSCERRPMARAAAGSKPRASQRGPSVSVAAIAAALAAPASTRSRVPVSSRLPKSSESTLPPEWKTSLAEHDAARERRDEHERREAVVPGARAPREALDAEREDERRRERAERRREAEAVGQHEAGERRRADGVGVERQPAHDDPRAEQARRAREQQHLEHAALHELQLKRIEHGEESNRYSFPLQERDARLARAVVPADGRR